MKNVVTNKPADGYEESLNRFFILEDQTWLRGFSEMGFDIKLTDLIRKIAQEHDFDIGEDPTDEEIDQMAYEWLEDGISTVEGITGILHMACLVASDLRARLGRYERDNTNVVIIKHSPAGQQYLFEVPSEMDLKDGDVVLCRTKGGTESIGHCVGDSFTIGEVVLKALCKEKGAKLPLSMIVGKYDLRRFDLGANGV